MNYSKYQLKPRQRAPYKEAIIFKWIIPSLIQPNQMFRACTSNHVAIKHQRIKVNKDIRLQLNEIVTLKEQLIFVYIYFFPFFA